MAKLASSSEIIRGFIEDIDIAELKQSSNCFRLSLNDINDLAKSINQKGLLQAIVARTKEGYFEVIAGNRRLNACKFLGWRKIPCQIVELDDKEAFEVSLIENIQRRTLNPIEEAKAFKTYVDDFGWGGIAQLAENIGKSSCYITKRISLLDLPTDIRDSIVNSDISPSTAEELIFIKDRQQQSELANVISKRHLSIRKVREILSDNENDQILKSSIHQNKYDDQMEKMLRSFDKCITGLKIAQNRLGTVIETIDDNWIINEILMEHKNMLHTQIDLLIKQKKRLIHNKRNIQIISE
jgi:ParB family chromosome partitioning protein